MGAFIAKMLLPTVSSLVFLPTASVAAKRGFHMEAMIYFFTMFFTAVRMYFWFCFLVEDWRCVAWMWCSWLVQFFVCTDVFIFDQISKLLSTGFAFIISTHKLLLMDVLMFLLIALLHCSSLFDSNFSLSYCRSTMHVMDQASPSSVSWDTMFWSTSVFTAQLSQCGSHLLVSPIWFD